MKITKRQLRRIINEWWGGPSPKQIALQRRKKDYQTMIDQMTFEQLKRKAFDSAQGINGKLSTGQYEYADVWEVEIPRLADYVDAAKVKAAEEGVTYDDVPEVRHNGGILDLSEYSLGLNENKMIITKSQLRKIIREVHPRAVADNQYVEMLEAVEELIGSRNVSIEQGAEEDEVYIMTGAAEGITVKVLRRGR